MFLNCAPIAINVGFAVVPPTIENPNQRRHFALSAPALPKQKLNNKPIPREEAVTGFDKSVNF